jgi:ubiquitin C-terminal hydrolase
MNTNSIDKFKQEKIGLCGFKNMGNTCYMNSILQLLIHSKTIVNFLLSDTNPYETDETNGTNGTNGTNRTNNEELKLVDLIIRDKIQAPFVNFLKSNSLDKIADIIRKNNKLDSNTEVNINLSDLKIYMDSTLTIKLAELINTLIYRGNSCITPSGFKKIIDRKIPSLRGFGQQDAHELLIGIFDIIIEETGVDSEPVINNIPDSVQEYIELLEEMRNNIKKNNTIEEKKRCVFELNKYREQNKEIINKYNGLKYMTNVFETKRKNEFSTTTTGYNPLIFNLLTFDANIFKCTECNNCVYKYEFNTILSLDVKPSLEESFAEYVKEELIERKCEICSNKKTIRKKQIWRPGMVLYIQLCRFNNLPNGRVYKNNQDVELQNIIDLTKYCDSSMGINKSISLKYKLRGISNHMGNLNGGHYTADSISIIDNKTWYHFDDSHVGRHQSNSFDMSSSYILMYEMENDL